MFQLDEILERDDLRLGEISSAMAEAKTYMEELRAREDEAKKPLGLG